MRPLSSSEIGNIERQVLALARELLGDGDQARDVVQEVLLRFWAYPGPVPPRPSSWLREMARGLCREELRRQKRRAAWRLRGPAPAPPGPAERLWQREIGAHLCAVLAELPLQQGAVVVLYELDELTYEQIAEVMACPVGTVMSRLHAARTRMRQALAARGVKKSEDSIE